MALFSVRPDGSGLRRVTRYRDASNPSWSPDGKRIVYNAPIQANFQLHVINANGHSDRPLTEGFDVEPSWSPDGRRIAFVHGSQMYEIYVVNAEGTGLRRLTDTQKYNDGYGATYGLGDRRPSWSPDGKQIAFNRNVGPHPGVWIMNADGSHKRPIGPSSHGISQPIWSPDGCSIAFTFNRGFRYDIRTMRTDGSGIRWITRDGRSEFPSWSPDGTEIVRQVKRAEIRYSLDIVDVRTRRSRVIFNDRAGAGSPAW